MEVHTNRIEGAWKHAKDHFRKLSGTKITQFEGHLAEIMWRSAEKGNVYQAFFDFLCSFYTLTGPAEYSYPTPLFNTWDGVPLPATNSQFDEWEIRQKAQMPRVTLPCKAMDCWSCSLQFHLLASPWRTGSFHQQSCGKDRLMRGPA